MAIAAAPTSAPPREAAATWIRRSRARSDPRRAAQPGEFALSPLQLEGLATGTLFTLGLCYVWLAFAEREVPEPTGYR